MSHSAPDRSAFASSLRSLAAALALAIAVPAFAASPAAEPASAPSTGPAAQTLKVVVVEVHGLVQARASDEQHWGAAQVGMVLGEGASFRTGPRARVTCQIPPDQTFRLDRLGVVRVDQAIRTGSKVKTDLMMEYGRTQYDIEGAGIEHESTIRSPSSTLAVRGTNVSLFDQPPFAPQAVSYTGSALYQTAQHQTKLGGWQYAEVNSQDGTAANTALQNSVVDPSFANARSDSEKQYVSAQTSRGAVFSFDEKSGIPTVQNGPGPQSDSALAASLPGQLNLVLRWTGNADLNLLADNEAGSPLAVLSNFQPTELLYPGYGLNVTSTGGTIPYNDKGGPNGGQEIAYWPNSNYPQGVYGMSAIFISGQPATLKFNAYLNGKPLNILAFEVDSQGNNVFTSQGFPILIKNTTITRPISAGDNDVVSVILFVPPDPSIENGIPQEPVDNSAMKLLASLLAKPSSTVATRPTPKPAAPLVATAQPTGTRAVAAKSAANWAAPRALSLSKSR